MLIQWHIRESRSCIIH